MVGITRDITARVQDVLGDRYRLERQIGQGGSSRVFLAYDPAGTRVALKVLHPELAVSVAADRFLREIGILAQLDHPRLTRLLDSGQADWCIYFVMDYVEGEPLRRHMDNNRPMDLAEAGEIACDLLDVLDYAHQHDVVHRDVKPDNVILATDGARLLDFGIARAIMEAGTDQVTKSGFAVGTAAYMSPEQGAAFKGLDHRSDIYSLGCVLFEMFTGQPPFTHPNEAIVLELHQRESPPDLATLRPEAAPFTEAVMKSLAKNAGDRWQTAGDMKQSIERAAG